MAKRRTLKAQLRKAQHELSELRKLFEMVRYNSIQCQEALRHIQSIKYFHDWPNGIYDLKTNRERITWMLHDMIESDEGYEFFKNALIGHEQVMVTSRDDHRKIVRSELELWVALKDVEQNK